MAGISGPKAELRSLKRFVAELDARYLAPHISAPSLAPPSRQETLDVAAFTVLAHGAIENFAEGVSLWLVGRIEQAWRLHKRATRATAMLMLRSRAISDEADVAISIYDTLRKETEAAKQSISEAIRDNNGIGRKHLHALFMPLGVDVPRDPVLTASLESLVALRHEWAHQYRFGASTPRYASEVKQTAGDCILFAEKLVANVVALRH